MGGGVPVGRLVIDRRLRLHREAIKRRPVLAEQRLHLIAVVPGRKPEGLQRRFLRFVADEPQRHGQRRRAEARIGDMRPLVGFDLQNHMTARRGIFRRRHPAHPCNEARYLEAQRTERLGQQRVMLEAVSAPHRTDEFAVARRRVERHMPPQQRIEIFEGNARRLRPVERPQRPHRRIARTGITDPRKVSIEIETVRLHERPFKEDSAQLTVLIPSSE